MTDSCECHLMTDPCECHLMTDPCECPRTCAKRRFPRSRMKPCDKRNRTIEGGFQAEAAGLARNQTASLRAESNSEPSPAKRELHIEHGVTAHHGPQPGSANPPPSQPQPARPACSRCTNAGLERPWPRVRAPAVERREL
eukprot:3065963-Pleurochrysis_carterae.AAC.2